MPKRRFTEEEVAAMRERYAAGGITQTQLAKHFDVTPATISRILHGLTYSPEGRRAPLTATGRPPQLTAEQVQQIRYRRNLLREKLAVIAEDFGVTTAHIHNIASGRSRKDVPPSTLEIEEAAHQERLHEKCQEFLAQVAAAGGITFPPEECRETYEERKKRMQENWEADFVDKSSTRAIPQ